MKIEDSDLKIETFKSHGHGGQCVNTTDSAVKITHIPTGIVVSCQDERSQIQNLKKAKRELQRRLDEIESEQRRAAANALRQEQIQDGDRARKVRTYNAQRDNVKDVRLDKTFSYNDVLFKDGFAKLSSELTNMQVLCLVHLTT